MIEFINEVENLREEIYNNSEEILKLLEERKQLAIKIGKCKIKQNLKIRNRAREIEILQRLGGDQYKNSILNMLFEFSINYEEKNIEIPPSYSKNINGIKYAEFTGEKGNLIFILSRILNPGSLIYCADKKISQILAANGHHIIDSIENPDLVIHLDGRSNQEIILRDSSILISEQFFSNKDNIYNIEMM
ncbi:chorismate mutase [Ferroplasma sp.]|uniref:chorismate mutase n=1 Tax=Ferroplasma sp. TaxID=2591003 RepID=UPI00307EEFDA